MKTMSLFDFKHHYYKKYPNSTYRFGQHFLNVFVQDSTPHQVLWNEKDNHVAESLIYSLIMEYNWDMMSLKVLRGGLL